MKHDSTTLLYIYNYTPPFSPPSSFSPSPPNKTMQSTTTTTTTNHLYCSVRSFLLSLTITITITAAAAATLSPPLSSLLQSDAVPILSFKSKADLDSKLLYTLNEHFDYCQWRGVTCSQGRVVRFVLQGFGLRGTFPPDTLTRLDQLRVLSLHNNSLSGPVPDLSGLFNLKSLFLSRNSFSGSFPPSVFSLHRIRAIDLSYNNFTGLISVDITGLDRLTFLRLDWNRFNGSVPPLNQTSLKVFNVSGNNFTGPVPITPTLSRFGFSSFSWNPNLCGEIINKDCHSSSPFFESSVGVPPPSRPTLQNAESQGGGGGVVLSPPSPAKKHKRTGLILGFVIVIAFLIISILFVFALLRKQNNRRNSKPAMADSDSSSPTPTVPTITMRRVEERVSEPSVKKVEEIPRVKKSGNLVFCAGESQAYTLEQLMRASAELLGRGTMGTTYKAVLDNQLIVSVKRVDAVKTAITSGDVFERHMESVGGLRHPNLVPIRAYFQANEERLIVYDYQPNGSLFNLIHGSRSMRAKPLHWTSCLKIAEDVAQGLAYIHQASRLVHGNLKSSNVLLGSDFEACLADYCLAILARTSSNDDPDSAAYKAPETRKSSTHATPKSDVYAFGILLLELLTGRHPSQHPFLMPTDLPNWVRAMRDDDNGEDDRLGMLVEVASVCSLTSPEQRPLMWQVLRMIQEIKESVMMEDHTIDASVGFS